MTMQKEIEKALSEWIHPAAIDTIAAHVARKLKEAGYAKRPQGEE